MSDPSSDCTFHLRSSKYWSQEPWVKPWSEIKWSEERLYARHVASSDICLCLEPAGADRTGGGRVILSFPAFLANF